MNLKTSTQRQLRLTWGMKKVELPIVGTTVPSHDEPSNHYQGQVLLGEEDFWSPTDWKPWTIVVPNL